MSRQPLYICIHTLCIDAIDAACCIYYPRTINRVGSEAFRAQVNVGERESKSEKETVISEVQHVVSQAVHVSRNVKEMGEVSRIHADRTKSKYHNNQASTIDRLFGVWPTLINTEVEKNCLKNKKQVEVQQPSVRNNESNGIVTQPITSIRHEYGGPLSKNSPKIHQV